MANGTSDATAGVILAVEADASVRFFPLHLTAADVLTEYPGSQLSLMPPDGPLPQPPLPPHAPLSPGRTYFVVPEVTAAPPWHESISPTSGCCGSASPPLRSPSSSSSFTSASSYAVRSVAHSPTGLPPPLNGSSRRASLDSRAQDAWTLEAEAQQQSATRSERRASLDSQLPHEEVLHACENAENMRRPVPPPLPRPQQLPRRNVGRSTQKNKSWPAEETPGGSAAPWVEATRNPILLDLEILDAASDSDTMPSERALARRRRAPRTLSTSAASRGSSSSSSSSLLSSLSKLSSRLRSWKQGKSEDAATTHAVTKQREIEAWNSLDDLYKPMTEVPMSAGPPCTMHDSSFNSCPSIVPENAQGGHAHNHIHACQLVRHHPPQQQRHRLLHSGPLLPSQQNDHLQQDRVLCHRLHHDHQRQLQQHLCHHHQQHQQQQHHHHHQHHQQQPLLAGEEASEMLQAWERQQLSRYYWSKRASCKMQTDGTSLSFKETAHASVSRSRSGTSEGGDSVRARVAAGQDLPVQNETERDVPRSAAKAALPDRDSYHHLHALQGRRANFFQSGPIPLGRAGAFD